MKVKIKRTGEIIEVTPCFDSGYSDKNGFYYMSSEVELIETKHV
jgi:hypothetical protein